MASNLAQRRAAKAAHRKQLLLARRAAEPVSLADRVRHLARGPIVHCVLQPEMFETGIGTVLFARKAATGEIATAIFLVDAFSIGIKEVIFDAMEPSEVEFYISTMQLAAPWQAVEPSYARKLLHDAAAYAATLGVRPHRGFPPSSCCSAMSVSRIASRPLHSEVTASRSTSRVRRKARRLGRMAERLGPDGFDFVIPISEEEAIVSQHAEPLAPQPNLPPNAA